MILEPIRGQARFKELGLHRRTRQMMSFLLGSLYYFDSDLDSDLFKTKPNSTENQAQLILSSQRRLLLYGWITYPYPGQGKWLEKKQGLSFLLQTGPEKLTIFKYERPQTQIKTFFSTKSLPQTSI